MCVCVLGGLFEGYGHQIEGDPEVSFVFVFY